MDKNEEIHGLLKIPDSILLKMANEEIGKLKAYIMELEHKIASNINIKKSITISKNNRKLVKENDKLRKLLKQNELNSCQK